MSYVPCLRSSHENSYSIVNSNAKVYAKVYFTVAAVGVDCIYSRILKTL